MCLALVPIHSFACCIFIDDPNARTDDIVRREVRRSAAVFTGTVDRFEYRKGYRNLTFEVLNQAGAETPSSWRSKVAIVKVDHWWKMAMPPEVILVTDDTIDSAGQLYQGFDHSPFAEGESYLIYADGTLNELRGRGCSRTVPLSRASDDLAILGPGNAPIVIDTEDTTDRPHY